MTYQVTGFGVFSVEDQKNVCLANQPSGAYWDDTLGHCSGLTQDGSMMMCAVSGGTWNPSYGCLCPPSGVPDINAAYIGCQGQVQAPAGPRGVTAALARSLVARKTAPAKPAQGGGGGGGAQVIPLPEVTNYWPWFIGGGVLLVGAGAYLALRK